jgi:hypothetical protein
VSTEPTSVQIDPNVVHDIMIARLSKQNTDLVREVATLEAYIRMLQGQISQLTKGSDDEEG